LNWLENQRRSHFAETGTLSGYREDIGSFSYAVSITWGQTEYDTEDEGVKIRASNLDAIVAFTGQGDINPEVGDVIEGQSGRKATVVDLGTGSWSWTDPFHNARRVHVSEDS